MALPEGELDSLERVLEGVQRVLQLGGGAEWTGARMGGLIRRAGGLPPADAHTALVATASLLASMCVAGWPPGCFCTCLL